MIASENNTCVEDYCSKGSYIIDVIGRTSSFDVSTSIRMGNTMCEETKWNSYSSIVCHVAEGCAFASRIIASAAIRPGSTTTGFTYFRLITSMDAPNGKVTGGLSLTLTGKGFGEADYTPRIRMADSACDAGECRIFRFRHYCSIATSSCYF